MNNQNARRAIQKIAQREGVTEAQVVADMERAMEEMRQDAYTSADPRKIAFWESFPHKGEKPTAYEFVEFMSQFAHNMV